MEPDTVAVVTEYVSDIKFYGIVFVMSALGHLAHWYKKSSVDKGGSLKQHFMDQFPSTVAAIVTGFGTLYMALDPILVGVAWKATIIAAFTTGFASDSAVNGKFGKSNYEG